MLLAQAAHAQNHWIIINELYYKKIKLVGEQIRIGAELGRRQLFRPI